MLFTHCLSCLHNAYAMRTSLMLLTRVWGCGDVGVCVCVCHRSCCPHIAHAIHAAHLGQVRKPESSFCAKARPSHSTHHAQSHATHYKDWDLDCAFTRGGGMRGMSNVKGPGAQYAAAQAHVQASTHVQVCMQAHVQACGLASTHVRACMQAHAQVHGPASVHKQAQVQAHMTACLHTHKQTQHTYAHTHAPTHTRTYARTHAYTQARTHTRTHA